MKTLWLWRIVEDGDTIGYGEAWEKVTLYGYDKSWKRMIP